MPKPIQNPPNPFPVWRLKSGVKNATNIQLEMAEESCELWGWTCAGILIAGLIVECFLAGFDPPHASFWGRWGGLLADCLVVIGVAGEIQFARMGSRRQGELTRRVKKQLGEANERAATAELTAENLKAQFAWRSISDEVGQKLVSALSAYNGAVTIEYVSNDPEAQYFALALKHVFSSAEWQVGMMSQTIPSRLVFGLFVPDVNGPQRDVVRAAFGIAGIEFSDETIPPTGTIIGMGNRIPDSVVIFVGSKRPKFGA